MAETKRELHLNRDIPQAAPVRPVSRTQRTKAANAAPGCEGNRPVLSLSKYRNSVRVIREAFARTRTIWGTHPGKEALRQPCLKSGLELSLPAVSGSAIVTAPSPGSRQLRTAAGCKELLPCSRLDGGRQCQARISCGLDAAGRSSGFPTARQSPSLPSPRPCRSRSGRVRCRASRAASPRSRESVRRSQQTDARSPHSRLSR